MKNNFDGNFIFQLFNSWTKPPPDNTVHFRDGGDLLNGLAFSEVKTWEQVAGIAARQWDCIMLVYTYTYILWGKVWKFFGTLGFYWPSFYCFGTFSSSEPKVPKNIPGISIISTNHTYIYTIIIFAECSNSELIAPKTWS